ncbi:MAG: Na/Pi cotransporter family protein [Chitinophagaceae bacterium]|nr:Na/Pi cotransporter family protein [Chitinophagaceae bacterium]MCA6470381.1 Na/Pi cotransporter family protein [Chitinophagaceae bacterium]MCA6476446.1 Na/Pi cotransporter family protein [Chitinophagaceae bacterium]MCA6493396.1 Na/Pi cotransporter family protein [Chitinophagaceae bacterium]MCA6496176.1 Na/Pi cotransporter family protein [Chitinophagaceae bacterium]
MFQLTELLAGIGLFLFAMHFLEISLKELSGRKFKLFLQKVAARPLSAVAGSALITGILQSSSMVSLMVLAFLGAGVFTLEQSLALILGANLGTTLDSWLIAVLGFQVNIEAAAFPAIFLGAILLLMSGKRKQFIPIAYFLLGFGLLFLSIYLMKNSMESVVRSFKIEEYISASPYLFLLIGFLITLLMQSSSVTMAIVLTAIHGGILPLEKAVYIVLGGETGTTIKIWLAALGGSSPKKQVAAGNFIFNLVLTLLTLFFMEYILRFILSVLGIQQPLIALVTFSSIINLAGILLFVPLLKPFAALLVKMHPTSNHQRTAYLLINEKIDADTAAELLQKETGYFIYHTMLLNNKLLQISSEHLPIVGEYERKSQSFHLQDRNGEEHYHWIKELHGEIQAIYFRFTQRQLPAENSHLGLYISSIRNAMHAAKSIKDITDNISNLSRSSKSLKFDFFTSFQQEAEQLNVTLLGWLQKTDKPSYQEILSVSKGIEKNYNQILSRFYLEAAGTSLTEIEITTLINFSRECFSANRSMLMAVKDLMLDEKEAALFNEEPVFIS